MTLPTILGRLCFHSRVVQGSANPTLLIACCKNLGHISSLLPPTPLSVKFPHSENQESHKAVLHPSADVTVHVLPNITMVTRLDFKAIADVRLTPPTMIFVLAFQAFLPMVDLNIQDSGESQIHVKVLQVLYAKPNKWTDETKIQLWVTVL